MARGFLISKPSAVGLLLALTFLPTLSHASNDDATFIRFAKTLSGTMHCRSSDYPIEYTLTGDPKTHEMILDLTLESKPMISQRRLHFSAGTAGLSFTAESNNTDIRISAEDLELKDLRNKIQQNRYVYAGALVYTRDDRETETLTAFHGACSILRLR